MDEPLSLAGDGLRDVRVSHLSTVWYRQVNAGALLDLISALDCEEESVDARWRDLGPARVDASEHPPSERELPDHCVLA